MVSYNCALDIDTAFLVGHHRRLEAVRRRLGHASTETTQIYTLLTDKVADEEVRGARRRRERTGR